MVAEPQKTSNEFLIRISSELLAQEKTLISAYHWLIDKWRYFQDHNHLDPETRDARNRLFDHTAAYRESLSEFEDCIIQTIHTIDCECNTEAIHACLWRIRETIERIAYIENAPRQLSNRKINSI